MLEESIISKKQQAIEACNKVINGIEDENISVQSALLTCRKIARLVNDQDGMLWLKYEAEGYPHTNDGHLESKAFYIGENHGRGYVSDGTRCIFTEICSSLENDITNAQLAIGNFSTQGFAPSGDYALLTTQRMTQSVAAGTSSYITKASTASRKLSILKSEYYNYAMEWLISMNFSDVAGSVFDEYQEKVSKYFSAFPAETLQKVNAIDDYFREGNPEAYAQVMTSCRRLWTDIAKILFNECFPNNPKKYHTVSGIDIDVSGDHINNKLSAVIESWSGKATKNTLTGSESIYLVDWMENLNDLQNTGVHSEVTREEARRCILQTYIVLGDILELRESAKDK